MPKYKIILDENSIYDDRYSYYDKYQNKNNDSVVILIILIIIVLICLWFAYKNNSNSKNSFEASPQAHQQYNIASKLLNNSNGSYTSLKTHIPSMDSVKHRMITQQFQNGTLRPETFDLQ